MPSRTKIEGDMKIRGAETSTYPDSKVHVAHIGLIWVLPAPGGPHVGPMNLAIREGITEPVDGSEPLGVGVSAGPMLTFPALNMTSSQWTKATVRGLPWEAYVIMVGPDLAGCEEAIGKPTEKYVFNHRI